MAPVITSINPNHGPTGTAVTITGSGFTGATSVKFGTVPVSSFTLVSDTQITTTAPSGSGAVSVTVTTPLGTSNGVTYTYATAPVITSLNPSSGPVGTTVTISGSGFTGATAVKFGSVSASFSTVSDTQITATAPTGSGAVAVTVTTSLGTSNSVTFTYTVVSPPTITSLNPNTGAAGTQVTINGSAFTGATAVKFGSVSALFSTVGDTQITAIAPAGSGAVPVTVTTSAGTSNSVTFTYVPAPVINTLSPDEGPTSGGNTVVISGSNLLGATSVKFGNHSAAIGSNTGTQITVTAPASAAEEADVKVTTPSGTSNALPYFYIAAPTVTSIDPTMGPTSGGNTVTIFGTNLTLTTAVHFGAGAASNINVLSDTEITAQAPNGTGTVLVTVTTPGGTSTAAQGDAYYIYVAPPVINTLTPAQGSVSGGDDILIAGSHLTYTDQVLFGSTPASFEALSDNQVVATSPAGSAGPVNVTLHTPGGTSNALMFQYQP